MAKETKPRQSSEEKNDKSDAPYEGTVRVVTEKDLTEDPRLVAASVVVGQLYDFSNLPSIPEEAAAENVHALNENKDENEARTEAVEENPAVNRDLR